MPVFLAVDLGAETGRVLRGVLDGGRLHVRELHRFVNRPVTLPQGLHWDVLALFAEPSPAVLKAMLHEAGRIATPALRMPLQAASAAGVERARRSAPSRSSARAPARAR